MIDIIAAVVIIITAIILSRGMTEAARENVLVILKVFAIVLFIIVGLTAIQASNYVPFIPEHKVTENGDFGGWQGIYAGVSMIFLAYIDLIQSQPTLQKLSTHKEQCLVVFLVH